MPFPEQVQRAFDNCPGTVRMEVYATEAGALTPDVPCSWTTIPDAVILCYAADGTNLGAYAVEG